VQDDPFSATSYIPAEFKEFKEDQVRVGSNRHEDDQTVLTGGNENYFLTNE
jgi:hypothetical protein